MPDVSDLAFERRKKELLAWLDKKCGPAARDREAALIERIVNLENIISKKENL